MPSADPSTRGTLPAPTTPRPCSSAMWASMPRRRTRSVRRSARSDVARELVSMMDGLSSAAKASPSRSCSSSSSSGTRGTAQRLSRSTRWNSSSTPMTTWSAGARWRSDGRVPITGQPTIDVSRACFRSADHYPYGGPSHTSSVAELRCASSPCETARVRVFLGSDHAGFELKAHLLRELAKAGHDVVDVGPAEYDAADDYPPFCIET